MKSDGPKIVKRGSEYWITGGGLQEDQGPYRERDVAEDDLVGLRAFLEEKWVKDGEGGYVRSGKRVTLVVKPMRKRAARVPVAAGKRGVEATRRRPPRPFVKELHSERVASIEHLQSTLEAASKKRATRKPPKALKPIRKLIRKR